MQLSSSIGGQLGEFAATYPFDFISKIQFIHPNESVVFGSHSGGILRFTTKTGEELRQAPSIFLKLHEPIGYQEYTQFYSPKYELQNKFDFEPKSTLDWIPFKIIDGSMKLITPNDKKISVTIEGQSINGTLIMNTVMIP